jgi:hypothetical protein
MSLLRWAAGEILEFVGEALLLEIFLDERQDAFHVSVVHHAEQLRRSEGGAKFLVVDAQVS